MPQVAGKLKIKILRLIVKPLHMDRTFAERSKIMIHKLCVKQKYVDKYETLKKCNLDTFYFLDALINEVIRF